MRTEIEACEIEDLMRQVTLPGMGDCDWFPVSDNEYIYSATHDIFGMGQWIGGQDDKLWNSIRFGYCEAVHEAIRYWHDEIGILPGDYEEMSAPVRELVDACVANPNPENVPWHLFRWAMQWNWPENFYLAQDAVLENDDDRRYEIEVRHYIAWNPDSGSWEIKTQIAGGWAHDWTFETEFTLSRYATYDDIRKAQDKYYPSYLVEGL